MEQVFAPWRIEWVERNGGEDEGCVFCELPAAEQDRESRVVARSEHAYVLLNNYPYNPGHVMVIPETHTGEYGALSDAVLLDHARLKQRALAALEQTLDPDGFNTGCNLGHGAGGSIDDHLHTHVVPRWEEDTNFMPVISETKVIVDAVENTYDKLHEAFAAQDGTETTDAGAIGIEPAE
ncbi:HIT family protein [Halocatena pleomorpha]|uniref:HIT domain-containing protein n=1 Tax=Halocatena pleomorpha TaxID=1785090 RepID=A0A3P3R5F0_9EURY|nr:HIT domain-containing protein [Halocatena pleomorpha]RRJ28584.1 HIT domain-containing protein [Halocatena pleomorpha]